MALLSFVGGVEPCPPDLSAAYALSGNNRRNSGCRHLRALAATIEFLLRRPVSP
jgi:hypothetical protein